MRYKSNSNYSQLHNIIKYTILLSVCLILCNTIFQKYLIHTYSFISSRLPKVLLRPVEPELKDKRIFKDLQFEPEKRFNKDNIKYGWLIMGTGALVLGSIIGF